ncbi:hypothetical protein [Nocardia arthritidis]|uniref:Type II toxin-antitoxin system PemK/MazF family toxin n=1 Tax=Nocardia arthritidis TaxID=228602 RepID=A0A6G9YIU8_9NOCA|nr:hypothetical protein [Nocardia arthritidis]QIS13118.1 hypothetical protein F5544_26320 [Nocardia arthritidis]
MKRGQVWHYSPALPDGTPSPRQSTVVLVSDPAVITSPYRWLHAVPLVDADPGHVLAVETSHGWADALELHRVYREWLTEQSGELTDVEADSLDARLRATLSI